MTRATPVTSLNHILPSITLPGTEHRITRIGLGGMPLSLPGRPDRAQAKAVIRTAVEAGITLIDTADAYALDQTDIGHNERLIAETLSEMGLRVDGGRVVVATKGGRTRKDGRWGLDGRPEHLRAACEASLRALGADRLPLYQLHSPDVQVPLGESVGMLGQLRQEGKIEAIGLSNISIQQLAEARSLVPVASVQNPFSVWDIGYTKSKIVEECRRLGIVFLAYSPLGGAKHAPALGASAALSPLARELDCTAHELALAWLIHQAPIVVPIPGASRPASILSSAQAASVHLDGRTIRRLRRAFRTLPGHQGVARRIANRLMNVLSRESE